MEIHNLEPGQHVRVHTQNGPRRGSFDARVERLVTVAEYRESTELTSALRRALKTLPASDDNAISQAVLMPDSPDVRQYLGGDGTYTVGIAHWNARLELI